MVSSRKSRTPPSPRLPQHLLDRPAPTPPGPAQGGTQAVHSTSGTWSAIGGSRNQPAEAINRHFCFPAAAFQAVSSFQFARNPYIRPSPLPSLNLLPQAPCTLLVIPPPLPNSIAASHRAAGGKRAVEGWHPALDGVPPRNHVQRTHAPEEIGEVQVEAGGKGAGQERSVGQREAGDVPRLVHKEAIEGLRRDRWGRKRDL